MYLVIRVDSGGYMYEVTGDTMLHKETRNAHKWDCCFSTLAHAKKEWGGSESDEAILELTAEGGGKKIWMAEAQKDKLTTRLSKWKGCYGLWEIGKLNA